MGNFKDIIFILTQIWRYFQICISVPLIRKDDLLEPVELARSGKVEKKVTRKRCLSTSIYLLSENK